MAATIVTPTTWQTSIGSFKLGIGQVNLGVYATGGVSVDPALFGLATVYIVTFDGCPAGFHYSFDYTSKKVKVWTQGITTGATAAGALANGAFAKLDTGAESVIRFSASVAATAYNFGPMQELANAVDLSSSTYNLRVRMEGI